MEFESPLSHLLSRELATKGRDKDDQGRNEWCILIGQVGFESFFTGSGLVKEQLRIPCFLAAFCIL